MLLCDMCVYVCYWRWVTVFPWVLLVVVRIAAVCVCVAAMWCHVWSMCLRGVPCIRVCVQLVCMCIYDCVCVKRLCVCVCARMAGLPRGVGFTECVSLLFAILFLLLCGCPSFPIGLSSGTIGFLFHVSECCCWCWFCDSWFELLKLVTTTVVMFEFGCIVLCTMKSKQRFLEFLVNLSLLIRLSRWYTWLWGFTN